MVFVNPVRVFISYSHRDDDHDSKVLELASRLRNGHGIDAVVDRYVAFPPEGWPRWVMRQIDEADFVLCLCSPTYRMAFEGRSQSGTKLGVNQEGYLIAQSLYRTGHVNTKFFRFSSTARPTTPYRGTFETSPGSSCRATMIP
jgi:hypothetical protein